MLHQGCYKHTAYASGGSALPHPEGGSAKLPEVSESGAYPAWGAACRGSLGQAVHQEGAWGTPLGTLLSVRREAFISGVSFFVDLGTSSHNVGLPQAAEGITTGMGTGRRPDSSVWWHRGMAKAEGWGEGRHHRGDARRAALLAEVPGSRKGWGREKVGLGSEEVVGAVLQGSVWGVVLFLELPVGSNGTLLSGKVVRI